MWAKQSRNLALICGMAVLFFVVPNSLQAKGKKTRTLPGGVVFPNLNEAALLNPGTLHAQKGKSAQALYTLPPGGTTTHNYQASIASSSKGFGFGIGYTGSYDTTLTHGLFIGGGVSTGALGAGLSLREDNLDDTNSAAMDAGISYEFGKNFVTGLTVKSVTSDSRQLVAGAGFNKPGSYNFELNVTAPPFDNLGSSAYVFNAIGAIYESIFGAAFNVGYSLDTDVYTTSFSGMVSPTDSVDIFVTINIGTPNLYRFGLTLHF